MTKHKITCINPEGQIKYIVEATTIEGVKNWYQQALAELEQDRSNWAEAEVNDNLTNSEIAKFRIKYYNTEKIVKGIILIAEWKGFNL